MIAETFYFADGPKRGEISVLQNFHGSLRVATVRGYSRYENYPPGTPIRVSENFNRSALAVDEGEYRRVRTDSNILFWFAPQ